MARVIASDDDEAGESVHHCLESKEQPRKGSLLCWMDRRSLQIEKRLIRGVRLHMAIILAV